MTRVRVWRSVADVAVCLAVPAALVVATLVRPPVVHTADPLVSSCVERHGIRYCVHRDNAPRLEQLVRTVDPIVPRFGPKPSNVDEIRDQALLPRWSEVPREVGVAHLRPDGTVETDVTHTAVGFWSCDREGEFGAEQELIVELKSGTRAIAGAVAAVVIGVAALCVVVAVPWLPANAI